MSPASFDGLRASSFDAYSPDKWSSNVFTRERLEVKQRLLAMARELEPLFEELGLTLQRYASDEYPSLRNGKKVDAQWVFFWRTEEERQILEREVDLEKTLAATLADPTPMTRHAFLCLRLTGDCLEASFRLHRDAWVDQRNLRSKLADDERLQEFVGLVRALPESSQILVSGGAQEAPAECTAESLLALVERHGATDEGDGFLMMGLQVDRSGTTELGADLLQFIKDRLSSIVEIYRFVAWSEENNFVSSDAEFIEKRAQRGAVRQELDEKQAERRLAQEVKKKEQVAARKELEELFRREAAARSAPPRRPQPKPPSERPPQRRKEAPAKDKQASPQKQKPRPVTPPKKVAPREPQPVQAGHEARVTKGPLAGKIGLVQEIDAKGSARVMVGLLATRIPVDELVGLGPAPDADK